jgi:glycosyltransferase involved in cell wall biosynthesis
VHRPKSYAAATLAHNRRHYELLLEMAGHAAETGDVERLLRTAVLAANYAWSAPVGLLSDLRLERAVVHAVRGDGRVRVDGERRAGRVLHVVSEAYAIGGHTRQLCAWMARDDRASDVALTNQHQVVPDRIIEAVRASGGRLHDLRSRADDLLDRARALRALMDDVDLVVLTVHPWDAVALAAVNLPGVRPPVVYANHADHSYFLGVAGADLLCDWRTHTRTLDIETRGVPADRIAVLPLAMDPIAPPDGADLRRRLGIRPDAPVAVTVSADWKVAPAWGRGMHDVLDRVLHWSPQLVVVLVGISATAEWARLAKRYPGRVIPVGTVPDATPYLGIADIFLESYPLRAGTTPLEAAMAGLPVVALADLPPDDPAHLLHTGSPGVDGLPVLTSVEQFTMAVRRLAQDPELRRREAADVRAAVQTLHDGPGWRAQLEAVYERARGLTAVDVEALGDSPTDDRYGAMLLSASSSAESPDPRFLVGPLGDLYDDGMRLDLFALLQRDEGPSLHLRVAEGWDEHTGWTSRLLDLAESHPRLRVSLPFAADDDVAGSRTSGLLVSLLDALGQSPEDCGDIHVETTPPRDARPSVGQGLPFTDDALDWLERLLSSPFWRRPVPAGDRLAVV